MNQSELIEKVARATELNQAAAGRAVKAVVDVILDALLAGEAVRVSGLGIFNVAARPAREGRNPQTGETIKIAASKAVRFHAGKAVKDALNPPKGAPPVRSLHHRKNPRRANKCPLSVREESAVSRCSTERHAPREARHCIGGQARETALDVEIVVRDDAGVGHIDLQDTDAGTGQLMP